MFLSLPAARRFGLGLFLVLNLGSVAYLTFSEPVLALGACGDWEARRDVNGNGTIDNPADAEAVNAMWGRPGNTDGSVPEDVDCDGDIDNVDANYVINGFPNTGGPLVPGPGDPAVPPSAGTTDAPRLCEIQYIVQNLIRIALGAGGLGLFVMILLGGFKWLTAGGNDKAVAEAKGTITWAAIGVALMVASFFILQFITNFTGVNVTVFTIPWIGGVGTSSCP